MSQEYHDPWYNCPQYNCPWYNCPRYNCPSHTDSFSDFDNFEPFEPSTRVDLPDEQLDWSDESEPVIFPPPESPVNQQEGDLSRPRDSEPHSGTKSSETVLVAQREKRNDPDTSSSQVTDASIQVTDTSSCQVTDTSSIQVTDTSNQVALCGVSRVKTESSSQEGSNRHPSCDSYSPSVKQKNENEERSESRGSKRCRSPGLSHSQRTDSYHSSSSRGHRSPSPHHHRRSPCPGLSRSPPCSGHSRSPPYPGHSRSPPCPGRRESRFPRDHRYRSRSPRNHRIYRYEWRGSSEDGRRGSSEDGRRGSSEDGRRGSSEDRKKGSSEDGKKGSSEDRKKRRWSGDRYGREPFDDRYGREPFDRRPILVNGGHGRRSKSPRFERGGGRRSKSPRFDPRSQGGDFRNGRRSSPFNPNIRGGNSFPRRDTRTQLDPRTRLDTRTRLDPRTQTQLDTRTQTQLDPRTRLDPRGGHLRISPPLANQDPRMNQHPMAGLVPRMNQHPMAGLVPGPPRPSYLPRHIPSQAEKICRHRTDENDFQVDSDQIIHPHQPDWRSREPDWRSREPDWRSREAWESMPMDPRVGRNANSIPLNPIDPRIPPSFQVSNQNQGRALLPTPQTRPNQTRPDQTRPNQTRPDQTRPSVEFRPLQRHPDPVHRPHSIHPPPVHYQFPVHSKISALQRASGAFDSRYPVGIESDSRYPVGIEEGDSYHPVGIESGSRYPVGTEEGDSRMTSDQRRIQEELRRIESEKERKKGEAIEEAGRKLEERMRRKREALAREPDPLNWIIQPAQSLDDPEVMFESQNLTVVDCASPDDPSEPSHERERRSPSLEEIVSEDPLPSKQNTSKQNTSSGSVEAIPDDSHPKNPCKRCHRKDCHQPHHLKNPCKRCHRKDCHQPHHLKNPCKRCHKKDCYQPQGKPIRVYCYECSRIVLAEFRAQQSRVKKLSSQEKLQVHRETQERARKVAEQLKANEGLDSANSVARRRSGHVVKRGTSGRERVEKRGTRGRERVEKRGTRGRGRVEVGRPSRVGSRSLSPDSGGIYYANDSFPDPSTFRFDSIQVSKCWNCDHELNAPSDDVVLCRRCEKWNHNYHVDPVGYHNSEYGGDCLFCDQLKELKKNRKKKVEPIPSYPRVEIGEIEGDETPSGDQSMWSFYWNYLKNGHNIKTGDIVYRRRPGSERDECDLWWIQYLVTDAENRPWVYAVNLRLPQDIVRDRKQCFYARQVFPCTGRDDATWFQLRDALGRAVSLSRKLFFAGRPRGSSESDLFLMHQLWDTTQGEQGDTVEWNHEFSYFPLNQEPFSWKLFQKPIKVFKRNLMIEDGSYELYRPRVKDDRLS